MNVEEFRREEKRVEGLRRFLASATGKQFLEALEGLNPMKGASINMNSPQDVLMTREGSQVLVAAGVHHQTIMDNLQLLATPHKIDKGDIRSKKGRGGPPRAPAQGPTR